MRKDWELEARKRGFDSIRQMWYFYYEVERLPLREIANEFSITTDNVQFQIDKWGIKRHHNR